MVIIYGEIAEIPHIDGALCGADTTLSSSVALGPFANNPLQPNKHIWKERKLEMPKMTIMSHRLIDKI